MEKLFNYLTSNEEDIKSILTKLTKNDDNSLKLNLDSKIKFLSNIDIDKEHIDLLKKIIKDLVDTTDSDKTKKQSISNPSGNFSFVFKHNSKDGNENSLQLNVEYDNEAFIYDNGNDMVLFNLTKENQIIRVSSFIGIMDSLLDLFLGTLEKDGAQLVKQTNYNISKLKLGLNLKIEDFTIDSLEELFVFYFICLILKEKLINDIDNKKAFTNKEDSEIIATVIKDDKEIDFDDFTLDF